MRTIIALFLNSGALLFSPTHSICRQAYTVHDDAHPAQQRSITLAKLLFSAIALNQLPVVSFGED